MSANNIHSPAQIIRNNLIPFHEMNASQRRINFECSDLISVEELETKKTKIYYLLEINFEDKWDFCIH